METELSSVRIMHVMENHMIFSTNHHAFVGHENRFAWLISDDAVRDQTVKLGAYFGMIETNWHLD